MSLYTIKKLTIPNKNNLILIPQPLFATLKYYNQISLGTKICSCKIDRSDENDTIFVSSNLWDELPIPYTNKVHIMPNDETVYIGPLIGIFTAGFTGSLLRPIGDRSIFFAKILSSEKTVGGFTFVFGANHINWEQGTINGYFHSSNGWQQINVPFPNVVYDRLPNRKTENHNILKGIKKRLQSEYLIPWFNPGFFNKWDIHQIFSSHSVKQYLPETTPQPTISTISEFLTKYKCVYIKPINGSLGLGIHQIFQPADDTSFYCRFRKDEKNYLRKYNSLESLVRHQFQNTNPENYIVQQGISLVRYNEKPIDFRVHTNKDEFGNWKVSAIAAKVAGSGSVTTHIGSGGTVKTVEEIIKATHLPEDIINRLQQAVLSMSTVLEKEISGNVGEIGFDLGIDKSGEIWLFEANSKPGRSIFKHPKLREYDLLSRSLPISYAVFLTKKSIYEPEVLFNEEH